MNSVDVWFAWALVLAMIAALIFDRRGRDD